MMLLSDFSPKKPGRAVVEVHENDQSAPTINRGGYNKLQSKEDYLDKRDVLFRLLSQPGVDSETKAKARERLLDLEKAARLAGIVNEEENAMAQAVTRRIMNQHPEWIMQYGVELLLQVIDDVTEGDDWEEIGSSDVSAYVNMVHDQLRERSSREEMRDRRPFAEGEAEGTDDNKPRFTGAPQRDRDLPPIKNSKVLPPAPGRPTFTGKPEQNKKTTESLRDGEYHVATVTLKDGTEKKVKVRSDEGFRDPIIKHFAKQGLEVQDIKVDWSVHQESMTEKDDHGDLRTGWVLTAAKRAFPMAATDEEALAMWINDRIEKDVDRLDRENDREDRDIDRLDRENDQEQRMLSQMSTRDEQVEKKLNDLQAQVNVLYKANDERKPSRLESRLSTRATTAEISKYLAEMKKSGYDI